MKLIKRFIFQTNKTNLFIFISLLFILFLVFKSLIFHSSAVGGDAPYFYPEGLKELWTFPNIWVNRNHNFGEVDLSLWLAPLMFLYGSLHKFFSLNNDAIIRLLFYFPALIFSVISPIIFARFLRLPAIAQFFASLLYFANTYFLLLVDGGQIGVALAYSIFPLSLTFLLKLFDKPSTNNLFIALLFSFALQVADVRIALISVLTAALWALVFAVLNKNLSGIKNLWLLLPFSMALFGLSSYWLIPLMKVGGSAQALPVTNSQSTIFDSLTLFQPHWPLNQFGKVDSPPFYFVGIPFLMLGGLFFRKIGKKNWVATVCFLIFAFLAKGNSKPFGGIYEWAVTNIPFGASFRDSTKFFTPLMLFAGILLGFGVDGISGWVKNRPLKLGVVFGVAAFFLMIIKPAWNGELNGVLSGRRAGENFGAVYHKLSAEEGFFRTVWFPEKSPFSFQTEAKPALDAKLLVQNRPFASLNTGNDPYNFFSKDDWPDFFKLLGIKYLVLSGDPRIIDLTEDKKELEWVQNFIKGTPGVKNVGLNTSIPVYEIEDTRPKIFATNKLFVVAGSDDIYQKMPDSFFVANQGFLFLDDGKTNPEFLNSVASNSATLVFNNSDENDFLLSFLQKYFSSLKDVKMTEWAKRGSRDYLSWKYELLQKGVKIQEFDYGKGIQFSTVPGERTTVVVGAPKDGQYMLAVRSMSGNARFPLKIGFNNEILDILYKTSDSFEWYLKGPLRLNKGHYDLVLENISGTHVFNTAALVPVEDWKKAEDVSKDITAKFEVVTIDGSESAGNLVKLVVDSKWTKVDYTAKSPVRYLIKAEDGYPWIIFTDNFNDNWRINGTGYPDSLPFYSMINGFYVPKPSDKLEIVFKGQKQVQWGIYYSLLSGLGLLIVFSYIKGKKL